MGYSSLLLSQNLEILDRTAMELSCIAQSPDNTLGSLGFRSIGLEIDRRNRTITGPAAEVSPANFEFKILNILADNPNTVQTWKIFTDRLWQGIRSDSLRVHIMRIRRKFDEIGVSPDSIDTVREVGYVLRVDPADIQDNVPAHTSAGPCADNQIYLEGIGLTLDIDARTVTGPLGTVTPTDMHFTQLFHLASHPEAILDKNTPLSTVSARSQCSAETLRLRMSRLRDLLEIVGVERSVLVRVPLLGYRLATDASRSVS